MKKIACISIVLILLITPFFTNISALEQKTVENKQSLGITQEQMLFSQAEITTDDDYVSIKIDEIDTYISEPGKPKLPVYTKSLFFPLGTRIIEVNCTGENKIQNVLSKKIEPVPESLPKTKIKNTKIIQDHHSRQIEDLEVYSKDSYFPEKCFDYSIKVGRKDNKLGVLLFLDFYPVLYNPKENVICQAGNMNFEIKYEKTPKFFDKETECDMVIIAPEKFRLSLSRLIKHKEFIGIKTEFKSVESIYRETRNGEYDIEGENKPYDKPEMIKYFIKYALENWNITYVLLVGGRIGQLSGWHVPVRYAQMLDEDGSWWDYQHISDLYYADIYRYNDISKSYEFEDWDSNENNKFGEWNDDHVDDVDLVPDVYLGRLACRNRMEVNKIVKKIINYEIAPLDDSWFKKMVVVGGDTLPVGDPGEPGPGIVVEKTIWDGENWVNRLTANNGDTVRFKISATYEPVAITGYKAKNLVVKDILSSCLEYKNDSLLIKYGEDVYTDDYKEIEGNYYYWYLTRDYDIKLNDNEPGKSNTVSLEFNATVVYESEAINWVNVSGIEVRNQKKIYDRDTAIINGDYEGEESNDIAAGYMEPLDFEITRLWASDGTFSSSSDIIREVNKGCGFLYLDGHGGPITWDTYQPNRNEWVDDFLTLEMNRLRNRNKPPVCLVSACHSSQFDLGFINLLEGIKERGIDYFEPWNASEDIFNKFEWAPHCWSWNLVRQRRGGSIATIGNTGLGYTGNSEVISEHFFKIYSELTKDEEIEHLTLGMVHSNTISDYIAEYSPSGFVSIKCVEIWALLGDPSLQIGL